jgi:hypothetical protein
MSEHFTGCSTNSYPSTGSRGWAYKIGERSTIGGKDHILPVDLAENNLLAPVREEILAHVKATGIDLHKYFHHLNSSQAFALNLFYPFFERGQSKVLLRALGQRGIARDWAFERVWDKAEGTNVDVCWRLTRQCQRDTNVFCEVKLTEQKFGRRSRTQITSESCSKYTRLGSRRLDVILNCSPPRISLVNTNCFETSG